MNKNLTEQDRVVIKAGVELLQEHCAYTQASVHRKLARLGCKVAIASLNNIINDKPIGAPLARKVRLAMEKLVWHELGWQWNSGRQQFLSDERPLGWQPDVVPEAQQEEVPGSTSSIIRPEGRLTIKEKVEIINEAQHEVIEFGLRLRTFSSYFLTRSAYEFKNHIVAQLSTGVHFKLYLLDPDCNEARLYFDDRARVLPEEREGQEKARASVERLSQIKEELMAENSPGDFQVFFYRHIPVAHFLIIDGKSLSGQMIYAPYLYGIRRADCPVSVISKQTHRQLFRTHYQSFLALSKDATRIF
ncbi:MAG: hypothetical protein RIC19_11175 [Phaeodactylibacter sp.]|uniref:hypothetical protein n=1 Tax=Phaeodactylibacter sp. TaxID=1940289 RepID=UPI0032F075CF